MLTEKNGVLVHSRYSNFLTWIFLILLLAFGAWMRLHGATRPLVGYFDGGRTALEVRNLKTLPVSEHRYRPVDNPRKESYLSYMLHPPFVVFFSLFMEEIISPPELAVRLGSVLFSTLTTLLFFLLSWKTVSLRAAFFTAAIATVAPLGSYYGGTAFVHDVAFIFFSIALLAVITLRPSGPGSKILCLTIIVFGAFSDVHFHFMAYAAAFVYFLAKDRLRFKLAVISCIATVIAFALWLLYVQISSGDASAPFRCGIRRTGYTIFFSAHFYSIIFKHLNITISSVGVWVGLLGGLWGLLRKSNLLFPIRTNPLTHVLAILLVFGLLPIVFFPSGAEMHIFWVCSLFPFFSLLFGAVASRLPLYISLALLVPVSLSSLMQWSRMKVQNDYRAYKIGQEISRVAPKELIFADENPNLLWFYLNTPIQSINRFKSPTEIVPSANENNVDFILTSGAYIVPENEQLLASFAPIYQDSGYFIYGRRSRLRHLVENGFLRFGIDTSQNERREVKAPALIPFNIQLNKEEMGSASITDIVVYWVNSNSYRKEIFRAPLKPRIIETSNGLRAVSLIYLDQEFKEFGTLSITLEKAGIPLREVANYPVELNLEWQLFPKWWWQIFPRS